MKIDVPKLGTIFVDMSPDSDKVTFVNKESGDRATYELDPMLPGRTAYQAVCSAVDVMEMYDLDASLSWGAYFQIPIGEITVTREKCRIVDDGDGGIDEVIVASTKETVPVLREYRDSLAECVMRSVGETDPGEDFGTLDCVCPGETCWRTVPFRDTGITEESERIHGEAYIAHHISFNGEIIKQLPQLARELKEAGVSW